MAVEIVGFVLEAMRNMVFFSMGSPWPLCRHPTASWSTTFPSFATSNTAPTRSPARQHPGRVDPGLQNGAGHPHFVRCADGKGDAPD